MQASPFQGRGALFPLNVEDLIAALGSLVGHWVVVPFQGYFDVSHAIEFMVVVQCVLGSEIGSGRDLNDGHIVGYFQGWKDDPWQFPVIHGFGRADPGSSG